MLTRAEGRAFIRELMDDASSKLWSDLLLDRLTTLTLDSLWGELLEVNPRLTSQLDTIATLQAPGFIRLALTTDTPAGDLSQRFRSVQSVNRNEQGYSPVDARHIVIQGNELIVNDSPRRYGHLMLGRQLWLFPLDTAEDVELRYSYLPEKFSSRDETELIEWPEGFDDAWTWEVAGRAMMKGGREDAAGTLAIADKSMASLKSLIKPSGVITPYHSMPAQAWGSE